MISAADLGRAIETPWRFVHCPNCGRRLVEMRGALKTRCKSCGVNITAETTGEFITVQACISSPNPAHSP